MMMMYRVVRLSPVLIFLELCFFCLFIMATSGLSLDAYSFFFWTPSA